jgi:serine protease
VAPRQSQTAHRVPPLVPVTAVVAALALAAGGAWASVSPTLTSPLEVRAARQLAYDPGAITVKFRAGVSRARIDEVASALQGRVTYVSEFTPGLRTLSLPPGSDVWAMVNAYRQRLDVEYAEPAYIDYPAWAPNDPRYSDQWNFPLINMPQAWSKVYGGKGSVVVAIVDTGIAFENYGSLIVAPDLAGLTFVDPKDVVDGDTHPNDEEGHGTHVCGTIAQQTNNGVGVAGIAFNVKIMPVRTLGPGGGYPSQFSDGVHWAVDHGARVINYSAGGPDSQAKHNAVVYAHDHGVLLIAAMGNDGMQNSAYAYPGHYPEAMGVGAVGPTKALAWYSNWGDGVDVVAPGGDQSTSPRDGVLQNTFEGTPTDMGYHFWQGTSMATPHVTGLAALLLSEGTYSTLASLRSRIRSTAADLGAPGYDTTFGWGLIDANAAIPTPPPPTLTWVGGTGYAVDGVKPNSAPAGSSFGFRARYQDTQGVPPFTARLELRKGTQRPTSYAMAPMSAGTFRTGKTYWVSVPIATAGKYSYRFRFAHGTGWATGDPAAWTPGPTVTSP